MHALRIDFKANLFNPYMAFHFPSRRRLVSDSGPDWIEWDGMAGLSVIGAFAYCSARIY